MFVSRYVCSSHVLNVSKTYFAQLMGCLGIVRVLSLWSWFYFNRCCDQHFVVASLIINLSLLVIFFNFLQIILCFSSCPKTLICYGFFLSSSLFVCCSFLHIPFDFCSFFVYFLCFLVCILSPIGLLCSSMFFCYLRVNLFFAIFSVF